MKLVKACIAMAAFAAIFVVPSVASASLTLTAPTGTVYSGNIIGTNVEHKRGETKDGLNTVMTTSAGNVECKKATLTGAIHVNNGTEITGNITTAEFKENPENGEADCKAPFGKVQVTPNHTTNPCHTPVGGSAHCSLPWCIRAVGAEDTFTVRGGNCTEPPRPLTFTLHITNLGSCSYEKASVTGEYTTHPEDAVLWIHQQEFKRITGSSLICPASGKLDMAFTLTEDKPGEVEGNTAYIDK